MRLLKRRTFSRSAFILKDNDAFTLIELLTVIAIISVLAALLFPIFRIVKGASRNAVCQSNEKQLITAIHLYLDDYDEYFPDVYFKYGVDKTLIYSVNRTQHELEQKNNPQSVNNLFQPYLKTKNVFNCPSDIGYSLPQDSVQDLYNGKIIDNPRYLIPLSERFGSSYRPAAELGDPRYNINLSDIKDPQEIFYFADFAGYWHTKYNRMPGPTDNTSEYIGDYDKWKQNVAYLDGHVKMQDFIKDVWENYVNTLYSIEYYR